ncbi:MAG: transposase [Salinivirgaceae bacterium]|nr:transposase [Salinivirgaceae bacterium]
MTTPESYRRKLPHIQPNDAVYFVTFSLKDSLPKHMVAEFSEAFGSIVGNMMNNTQIKAKAYKQYDEQIEELLHSGKYGNQWFKNPEVAQVIIDCFQYLDGRDFKLVCYCIMSNHVHFIAYNLKKSLHKIMHSLKSYSANECNKLLNRKGSFWQREYYDRIIRDRNDLAHKIKYIIEKPVKASIVGNWRDYPFTYCRLDFIDF